MRNSTTVLFASAVLLASGILAESSRAAAPPGSFSSNLDDDAMSSSFVGGAGSPGMPARLRGIGMESATLAHHTLLWLFALLGVPLLAGAKPLLEAIRNSPSTVPPATGRNFGVLRRGITEERKEPPTRRAA